MADLFDDDFNDDSSSDFAKMFEQSLTGVEKKLSPGDRIKGEILSIGKEEVFVSTGTMDDGVVLKLELLDKDKNFTHKVGDTIDLFALGYKNGQLRLSP